MNAAEPCDESEEPSNYSVVKGIRVSKRIMPARLAERGGDWCETFLVDDDTIALSIGDVCGHGEEYFAEMTLVRQSLRDALYSGRNPSQALTDANAFLYDMAPGVHATSFCGLLDARSGALTFANAGHPVPLSVSAFGAGFLTTQCSDIPLGIDPVLLPPLRSATILPDTLIVLYTDGVTEHERDPLRGEQQLLTASRFAHTYSTLPAAYVIEELMFLTGSNLDDASILTAWTPRSFATGTSTLRRRENVTRIRHRYSDAFKRPCTVARPRADDEIRLTLPGRRRWTGAR